MNIEMPNSLKGYTLKTELFYINFCHNRNTISDLYKYIFFTFDFKYYICFFFVQNLIVLTSKKAVGGSNIYIYLNIHTFWNLNL